eukprot:Skav225435  [mRNA]  locus=scaffold2854:20107:22147:- [translate_table: standard]
MTGRYSSQLWLLRKFLRQREITLDLQASIDGASLLREHDGSLRGSHAQGRDGGNPGGTESLGVASNCGYGNQRRQGQLQLNPSQPTAIATYEKKAMLDGMLDGVDL